MISEVKTCKWCGDPEPKHYPFQCFQNPKYGKYKMPTQQRMNRGSVAWTMKAVRDHWFSKNPPNHEGYYVCYLCGRWVLPIDTELDHVEARSRRPDLRYDLDNLKPACHGCNKAKGSLSVDEYRAKLRALNED